MRALARAQAAVLYYGDGIARIEDRWMRDDAERRAFSRPPPSIRRRSRRVRPRQSLSVAVVVPHADGRGAAGRLAAALLADSRHPRAPGARRRASAASIDLRERIAVVNAGRRRSIHADRLIAWAEQPPSLPPLRIVVVVARAGASVGGLRLHERRPWDLSSPSSRSINLVMLGVAGQARERDRREPGLVHRIRRARSSRERDQGDRSRVVRGAGAGSVGAPAHRATRMHRAHHVAFARLARISDWADSRHNVFLRLSEIPLLFTLQVAYAAESWRRAHGQAAARLGGCGRRNGSAAVARGICLRASGASVSRCHRWDQRRCSMQRKSRIR